jgi:hypothetical protein
VDCLNGIYQFVLLVVLASASHLTGS